MMSLTDSIRTIFTKSPFKKKQSAAQKRILTAFRKMDEKRSRELQILWGVQT